MIGYCIINKRVRENLRRTLLRCVGRKVPLLDSSLAVSSSSQNIGQAPKTPGFASQYDTTRRNIGISTSSTTSRSTAKTSSSPYRSDGQFRHTSTSTSNYNSNSDGVPSYMRGYDGNGMRKIKEDNDSSPHYRKERRHRRDSDSGSETDGRSLELASSHSSDDEESRVGRNSSTHRSTGVCSTSYLPNITEHVATTPPELHVVQSPQLFPNVNAPRWSSQAPESYLPGPNVGRWSQETASDNEVHPQNSGIMNSLPSPDITDTSYLHQSRMNMPPSILENIQERYNYSNQDLRSDKYNNHSSDKYTEGYRDFEGNHQHATLPYMSGGTNYHSGSSQVINHMRPCNHDNPYVIKDTIYERSRTLGYKTESPYISKERMDSDLYSPRTDNHGSFKSSVQSLLKNDYQRHKQGADSDRMSEGSDKNPYNFPYTAEEDHSTHIATRSHDTCVSMNHRSTTSSIQPMAPLTNINDNTEWCWDRLKSLD